MHQLLLALLMLALLRSVNSVIQTPPKIVVFGASGLLFFLFLQLFIPPTSSYSSCSNSSSYYSYSGGLGQWCCRLLVDRGYMVNAVTRDKVSLLEKLNTADLTFELLRGSNIIEADARELDNALIESVRDAKAIIISVGTTAFPSKKWENGNNPQAACIDTVNNILGAVEASKTKPGTIVLLSSIGVERSDEFPFKILNLYGILDAKLKAEEVFKKRVKIIGSKGIISRPGRLVGAPFTNTDLAKLFKIDQGKNQGIVMDIRENLSGDCERKDVADAITRLIMDTNCLQSDIVFSIINKAGKSPSEYEWGKLLSLFTTSKEDLLQRRET